MVEVSEILSMQSLDTYGDKGWELVSVIVTRLSGTSWYQYIFKIEH